MYAEEMGSTTIAIIARNHGFNGSPHSVIQKSQLGLVGMLAQQRPALGACMSNYFSYESCELPIHCFIDTSKGMWPRCREALTYTLKVRASSVSFHHYACTRIWL